MPASVEFKGVTKKYGTITAVDDVSFTIAPGTLVTLLGPSGCGKTTTLRMIAGLEWATSGKIYIDDKDVTIKPPAGRDVSMVFQSYALFPHMNVIENVSYGLIVSAVPKKIAMERARMKLELVGLRDFDSRLPSELSGGQQQRVAVARALVLEPAVLLFDEPLSNLDAKLRRKVRDDIRDLQQQLNLTVAYVTHDQEEALAVSDDIIVMSNAKIAQIGTPRQLYEEPSDLFVADFIGDANIAAIEITRIENGAVHFQSGGASLSLPFRNQRNLQTGHAILAIRPDALIIKRERSNTANLSGEVIKSTYLGGHMEYNVQTPIGELFVIDYAVHAPHRVGNIVWLEFAAHGNVVLPQNGDKKVRTESQT